MGLPYHTHSNVPAFSSRMPTLVTSWATTSPLNVTLAPSLTSNKEPEGKSCPADYATKTMGGGFVRSTGRAKVTFLGPAECRLDVEHFGRSSVIRHCNCAIDQICTIDDSSIKHNRYQISFLHVQSTLARPESSLAERGHQPSPRLHRLIYTTIQIVPHSNNIVPQYSKHAFICQLYILMYTYDRKHDCCGVRSSLTSLGPNFVSGMSKTSAAPAITVKATLTNLTA